MGEVGEVIPEKQQNEEVEGKIIADEEEITTVVEQVESSATSVNQNGTNGIHREDQEITEDDDVEMEEEDDDDEDKNNNAGGPEVEEEEVSQSYDESTKNTEDEVSNGVNGNNDDGGVDEMETDDSQTQLAQDKKIEEVEVIGSDEEDDESQDPLATKESHPTQTMEVDSGETLVTEKIVESVELSDDEEKPIETISEKPVSKKPPPPPDDDDDDDCVVIDDDDDDEPQMIDSQKNLKVRTFASVDEPETPPSKRQRTSGIQIKDARSLISSPSTTITPVSSKTQTPTALTNNNTPSVQIYPVGLRASATTTTTSSPPKLVPVSNTSTSSSTPTSTNVKDLLPGLTDDMFVLEAPSFIVPYIYEKPPENSLQSVVKKLEEKFDLKNLQDDEKENQLDEDVEKAIDEAAKSSNATGETDKDGKKKHKKNADDSWSEGSDEDEQEEDEDSDSVERTKVLIKDAGNELAALKNAIKPTTTSPKTPVVPGVQKAGDKGSDNFFESPLGKFFTDLGIGFVQEFVQADLLRVQKRKLRKTQHSGEASLIDKAVTALKENLQTSRKHNAAFRFNMKRCEYCSFKSESALSLALHYQSPHMNGVMYRCNFCPFEIRSSHEIIQHMDYVHNVKARIEKNPSYHACPNCPYEENGKAKLARHAIVCAKKFRPEVNLAPPQDWEAPAKIPRVKPRHGLVGTATAYQAMAAQAAAQKAVLETMQLQQAQRTMNMQNAKARTKNKTSNGGINKNNAALRNVPGLLPNNFQIQGGQLIQAAQNSKRHSTGSQQPSISITPLPRHSNSPAASTSNSLGTNLKMIPPGLKPGQSPAAGAKFVICEICDGYIKDLEQLRNHMQWMHKVKIHPKMIYNRPPLNCQKCQFRFFTDQGLERHLLGSHGLVTSSMQEAANKGKDSGRCPVCGRMYQWKLLNHVSRDHHMTLKPAHLSYKCTVCTATFGMYKQFETHVYTAHSTVAKKQLDGKKNSSGGGSTRSSSSTNDNLLKPLKINDEITIIPQPSSKATRTIDID